MIELGGNEVHLNDWVNTNTSLHYKDGVVRLSSDGYPWGIDHWKDYISQDNVEGIYLDNMSERVMLSLPRNIKTVYVSDKNHLDNVRDWITGESVNNSLNKVTLDYVGQHSPIIIDLESVSPSITRLHLPLGDCLERVINANPHLKSVGVNLDEYEKELPLRMSYVLWSSNKHRFSHVKSDREVLSTRYTV